jgi:hypothetical protein
VTSGEDGAEDRAAEDAMESAGPGPQATDRVPSRRAVRLG